MARLEIENVYDAWGVPMSDVSCRAFAYFEACAREVLVDLDVLLDGVPLERDVLSDPRQRVPWDHWALLCDRFGELVGLPGLKQSAEAMFEPGYIGSYTAIGRILVRPRDVYRMGTSWFAPMMYRNIRFETRVLGPSKLETTITRLAASPGL